MQPMTVQIREQAPPRARSWRPRNLALTAIAAAFVVVFLWARGLPGFVAWEVAHDHERCFGRSRLRARVWTSDPGEIRNWLESRGTPVQPLPAHGGGVEIVGVRYCALTDRIAAHIYYGGQGSLVSVMVLSGPARIGNGWAGEVGRWQVRLLRSAGRTIAIVGEVESDVDAIARTFLQTAA
jgi:hypothetical protein